MSWGDQVKVANDAGMEASRAAREETDRMMRELFGDGYNEVQRTVAEQPQEEEQPTPLTHPSEFTVAACESFILKNKLSTDELRAMATAESEGKERITLMRIIEEHLESA
jgi:hypothetical protein